MAEKKSSILKNTLVLVIVTFVAISALSVVNQITRGPIEEAEINARAEVYKNVYTDAFSFSEVDDADNLIAAAPEVLEGAGLAGCFINDVLVVSDAGGNASGYVIAATSPNGYGGNLQVAVGITNAGVIKGVEVVTNSETAGIGSKCTQPEFTSQFAGKLAQIVEYVKTGASEDNQIDAVSGATISTNAVTEAVNSAIVFYQNGLGGVVAENQADFDMSGDTDTSSGATAAKIGAVIIK